jgi:diguanylate cyclase (GGDEF)-like protein
MMLPGNISSKSTKAARQRSAAVALAIGIVLIVSVCLASTFAIWRAKEDALTDWKRFMSSMEKLASQNADQTIAAADTLLSRIADRVQHSALADQTELKREFGSRSAYEVLRAYKDDLPQVDVVTIVAANGDVINFSRSFPVPVINLADRDYFRAHQANPNLGIFLSAPVRNRGTGKWTFYLSRRLSNANGKMIGLVLIGIESDYLSRFYQSIELGHDEPVLTLTRSDGRVLARYPNDDAVMASTLKGAAYRIVESKASSTQLVSGPRTTNRADTRDRIVSAMASKIYPIALSLTVSDTLYLENWYKSAAQIASAALMASVLLLVTTLYVRALLLKREKTELDLLETVGELARAERKVQLANEELERRVAGRTELLQKANQSLDTELVERRRVEGQLEKLARFDPLTGLPNRTLFAQRLEQALQRGARFGTSVGLMFVDLDHFKSVNDSYGHEVGDLVLCAAGIRMQALLRHTDTVSRMGGDEFTVIIEDVGEMETFHTIADKLVKGFAAPLVVDNKELFLTLSVGIAISPADSLTGAGLMKQADFAMYYAKARGRNGFEFHSATMEDSSRARAAIEHALRHALERNEFELFYQIRVSAETHRPVGMEALLRWDSRELGFVSPVAFIPVAEDSGLIVDLGIWVLRTACEQLAAWRMEGLAPGIMGVNVSARQFRQADFAAVAAQIAFDCGVSPTSIELEVTESLVMSDPVQAQIQLTELRKLGFGIAIDDFGTGFSSLSHLKLIPATKLKIDRAFVISIDTDAQDQAIASAIVAMAKTLSMTVTAEGVETPAQLAQLSLIACDEYQGYLFGKPQSAQAIGDVLRKAGERALSD